MEIIFCVPSNNFDGQFLEDWDALIRVLYKKKIGMKITTQNQPVYYYKRNACLMGTVLKGGEQLPFQGEKKYDFVMFINTNISFTADDFLKLYYMNQPIVSGYVGNRSIVKEWDYSITPNFMTTEDIKSQKEPFIADYVKLDFMLIKFGVLEKLQYPWFRPIYYRNKSVYDFNGDQENVDFCMQLKEQGIDICVNPLVHIGRNK